jgi:hypothetical protein
MPLQRKQKNFTKPRMKEKYTKKKNHKTKQIQHFYKIKPNSENALHKDGKYLKLPLKLMW